jgi:hypothetical protein
MAINIWLECESSTEPLQCILALATIRLPSDGSLHLPNSPCHPLHTRPIWLLAAQQLATVLLQKNHCLASQHLKRGLNVAAHLLNFVCSNQSKPYPLAHDHLSNSVLTHHVHKHLPTQKKENFVISWLPKRFCLELLWCCKHMNPL